MAAPGHAVRTEHLLQLLHVVEEQLLGRRPLVAGPLAGRAVLPRVPEAQLAPAGAAEELVCEGAPRVLVAQPLRHAILQLKLLQGGLGMRQLLLREDLRAGRGARGVAGGRLDAGLLLLELLPMGAEAIGTVLLARGRVLRLPTPRRRPRPLPTEQLAGAHARAVQVELARLERIGSELVRVERDHVHAGWPGAAFLCEDLHLVVHALLLGIVAQELPHDLQLGGREVAQRHVDDERR